MRYTIYTDGCSRPHFEPHNGGWAFIALQGEEPYTMSSIVHKGLGYKTQTTNNEMECMAMLEAVKWLPECCDVVFRSDSEIAINAMGSLRVSKPELREFALQFQRIVKEKDIRISFSWVKGHDTDTWNDRVDILTNYARNTADVVYGVERKSCR